MEQLGEYLGTWGILMIGFFLIILGLLGSVLPALPGPPLALGAIYLVHFTFPEYAFTSWVLFLLTLLTIVIAIADYYIPILGTKKFGGSPQGVKGSTIGMIVGLLISFFTSGFGIIFLLAGPFVGAFIGEKYANNSNQVALKSAFGSFVGFLAGTIGKIVVVIIILIAYIVKTIEIL